MHSSQSQISPCNKKCIMDPVTNYCRGCFRTIEEIIQWSHSPADERDQIMREAELRKSKIKKNRFLS